MKKIFALLFLLCSLCAFAKDHKITMGHGLEWNMNSREGHGSGVVMSLEYRLPAYASIGFTLTGSTNYSGIDVTECSFLLRAYVSKENYAGPFFQFDLGASFITENNKMTHLPHAGLRGGYRCFLGTSFYAESYVRVGFPYLYGVGITMGISF